MALTGPATLDFTVNGRPYRETGNPPGNRSVWPQAAPHNTYPTAGDDNWIMITCTSDAEWEAFCEASDHPTGAPTDASPPCLLVSATKTNSTSKSVPGPPDRTVAP